MLCTIPAYFWHGTDFLSIIRNTTFVVSLFGSVFHFEIQTMDIHISTKLNDNMKYENRET